MTSPDDYENKNPGGLIDPKHAKPRILKMKWGAHQDRKLLLVALGKEIKPSEYAKIAEMFDEKPTPKAIQERLTKLRNEQKGVLQQYNITGDLTTIRDAPVSTEAPSPNTSSLASIIGVDPRVPFSSTSAIPGSIIEAAQLHEDASNSASATLHAPGKRKRESSTSAGDLITTGDFQPINPAKKVKIDDGPTTTTKAKKSKKTLAELSEELQIPREKLAAATKSAQDELKRNKLLAFHQAQYKEQVEKEASQAEGAGEAGAGAEGGGMDDDGEAEKMEAAKTLLSLMGKTDE